MTDALRSKWMLTYGCFLSFFAFGFIDNLKGPILPELLHAEQFTMSQGGTVFLGAYIGFIIATLLTGVISDLIGNRLVLVLAAMCLILGLLGVSQSESFWFLVMLMGCMGLGLGAIEVGANGLILELHHQNPGRYLNLLATFHGTGSFLVPLYVAWLIHWKLSWQTIFLSTGLLAVGMAVLFAIPPNSVKTNSEPTKLRTKTNLRDVLILGFRGPMGWYYLLISTYVAVELGVAAWLMEYLQQVRGQSVNQSSFYLSAFFVMIMLGRLTGSVVVDRMGYHRVVTIALIGGASCLLLAIFLPNSMLFLFSASGGFFSVVFPTITAIATRRHKTNVGSMLGILFTFGGLGGALGPWLIGVVSQWTSLSVGMVVPVAFCIVAIATSIFLSRKH
jgi:FHS family glucose/mannose:H+ symporter-like MFS transporter